MAATVDLQSLTLPAIVLGALGLAVLGSWIIVRIRREVKEFQPEDDPSDLLSPLHAAFIRGEIDEATYRRVRASVENRPRDLPGQVSELTPQGTDEGPDGGAEPARSS